MFFPIVIHKDPDSCFGVTIPDIPGCFTAGDTIEEALANVQEAVELHLEDAEEIPIPSDINELRLNPNYSDGTWVLVEIDFGFLSGEKKRVSLTFRSRDLHRIDWMADKHGMSRSAFLVFAANRLSKRALNEERQ